MQTIRISAQATSDRTVVTWLERFWPIYLISVAASLAFSAVVAPHHPSLIHAIVVGAIYAALSAFAVDKVQLHYDLVVTENEIIAQYVLSSKTIHRGRVRTIVERKRNPYRRAGIIASDKSRFSV